MKNTIIKTTFTLSLLASTLLATPVSKVFATVNGHNITSNDIAVALKDQKVKFESLEKEQQKQILNQVIQKKVLSLTALNSDISKSEVYLKTLELTITGLKEELALQIWMQNLSKDIKVSTKDAKDYFDKNQNLFIESEQYNANHILLKTKKEANDIIDKLKISKNLKTDFEKLAKEKSTGPSGKNGGTLGWFGLNQMVPEFSNATSKLKKNSITMNAIQTQFGFHVIYLNDKKAGGTVSFEQVENQIKNMLGQNKFKEKMDSTINNEMSKAKIIYK